MCRLLFLFAVLVSVSAFSADHGSHNKAKKHGLTKYASEHSVEATTDKLIAMLEKKGMTVFNRIDHAAGAKSVDLELRPTQLVIFGNPKVGTKLMQCSQTVGIDLPLKMLAWEDEQGNVWLGYHRPKQMVKKHRLEGCAGVIKKITGALNNFAKAATK